MEYSISFLTYFLLFAVVLNVTNGRSLVVPALFIFGDSTVDVGNNNYRHSILKANFPPYGRDFKNHIPTGRFSNGKMTLDYIAESLGFTSSPPAYLNLKFKGNNLLNGANFATAGSGYHDSTSKLSNALLLSQQLEYYKECQKELVKIAGESNATSIITGAIYIVSAGREDFAQTYYANPLLQKVCTPDQFSDILMQGYSNFIKNLYALGARRIGVMTSAPMGCLPIAITLFGYPSNECVDRLNNDAMNFNKKLNTTSEILLKTFPNLNLVLLDFYKPLYDLVTKPSEYGFFEARRACCGTGLLEVSVLCNQNSIGTCADASKYVFWDGFHPSDAANKLLAKYISSTGISHIT